MAKLYDKGQVVIPAEIRKTVGLEPGDQVVFAAHEDEVIIRKSRGVLEYVDETGGIPPLPRGASKEQMRIARDEAMERKYGNRKRS